jgi:hypothetical protein
LAADAGPRKLSEVLIQWHAAALVQSHRYLEAKRHNPSDHCLKIGTGEQLMLTSLSQQLSFSMQEYENIHEAMSKTLRTNFLGTVHLSEIPLTNYGFLNSYCR